jgi:hypothetical protein
MNASAGVPSLRDMCAELVSSSIINLDNSLAALQIAQMAHMPQLAQRAEDFIRRSWAGVRERHNERELKFVLGEDTVLALEREQADISASVARLKIVGNVTADPPADVPPASSKAAHQPISTPRTSTQSGGRPSKRFSFGGCAEQCAQCSKTVYPAERLAAHGKVFHQVCFRCEDCKCKLAMHSFEMDSAGRTYCKVHFAQLRRRHGEQAAPTAPTAPPSAPPVECGSHNTSPTREVAPATSATVDSATEAGRPLDPAIASTGRWQLPGWVTHEKCARCGKTVYTFERKLVRGHNTDDIIFHSACFRCAACNTLLREQNWELDGLVLLCKAHFLARQRQADSR